MPTCTWIKLIECSWSVQICGNIRYVNWETSESLSEMVKYESDKPMTVKLPSRNRPFQLAVVLARRRRPAFHAFLGLKIDLRSPPILEFNYNLLKQRFPPMRQMRIYTGQQKRIQSSSWMIANLGHLEHLWILHTEVTFALLTRASDVASLAIGDRGKMSVFEQKKGAL